MRLRRKIRLVLEYDGGGYHGWQVQPGVLTIQETVEACIEKITQHASRVTAAGRTDAGVHALQQVAHFQTPSRLPALNLHRGLNALLPPDIRIARVDDIAREFHARFSALGKRYEYRIWNGPCASAFQFRYAWSLPVLLDVTSMEAASKALLGRHDFTSFCAASWEGRHPVREVSGCGWKREGPLLVFWIEADAFLRYMVRTIVGTLVEVGMGKRAPEEMEGYLEARDRTQTGVTAPARGLFLVSVAYPPPWNLEANDPPGPVDAGFP